LIVLNLTIAVVFFGFSAWSKAQKIENECLSCHLEVYPNEGSNSYKHAPFEKGECGTCHLKQEGAAKGKRTSKKRAMEPVILTNPGYLTEHNILLKRLTSRASYDINLMFKDLSGNKVETKLRGVIPARVRNGVRNDKKPPVISRIKVGPIEKTPFVSTTIMWNTDEPSSSCVEYGLSDQYGERSPEDISMVRYHRVNICELEGGKGYHFRVTSRDMFGNQAVSEDYLFNTAKLTESDVEGKRESTELALKNAEIFLRRKRAKSLELGLYLETTRAANVTVECVKVKDGCTVGKELTIDACRGCHPTDALGLTHPVGVAARPTTKIPDYLPTLKGGIMTCVTCHNAHGGAKQYFTRKNMTGDPCILCHERH
jgi:predicted CXXCH cytochrome family protein